MPLKVTFNRPEQLQFIDFFNQSSFNMSGSNFEQLGEILRTKFIVSKKFQEFS